MNLRPICPTRWPSPGIYKDWGAIGEGVGNFLTYGDFPTGDTDDPSTFLVPRGVILDRDLSTIHEIDLHADNEIRGICRSRLV